MTDHDPIEALLKATGRRPAIPADRACRVREAALTQWRAEAAQRRRRRFAWAASPAAAAVIVTAVGWLIHAVRAPAPIETAALHVDRVVNAVWARTGSVPLVQSKVALRAGSIVAIGSTVTTWADARVALAGSAGESVRLDTGTTLRVVSGRSFVLEHGAVYVDSGGEHVGGTMPIRIDTPLGTIEDQGTQFEARLDAGSLRVRIREGAVTVHTRAGPLAAHAGQMLSVDPSGRNERTGDAGPTAAWAWAEAIAPPMAIDGRSLSEFLDWVARERGMRVRFADAALAERATSIVLSGSIAGMTLDQATASVLAASGLAHRWEHGALVVGVAPWSSPPPRIGRAGSDFSLRRLPTRRTLPV